MWIEKKSRQEREESQGREIIAKSETANEVITSFGDSFHLRLSDLYRPPIDSIFFSATDTIRTISGKVEIGVKIILLDANNVAFRFCHRTPEIKSQFVTEQFKLCNQSIQKRIPWYVPCIKACDVPVCIHTVAYLRDINLSRTIVRFKSVVPKLFRMAAVLF